MLLPCLCCLAAVVLPRAAPRLFAFSVTHEAPRVKPLVLPRAFTSSRALQLEQRMGAAAVAANPIPVAAEAAVLPLSGALPTRLPRREHPSVGPMATIASRRALPPRRLLPSQTSRSLVCVLGVVGVCLEFECVLTRAGC